MNTMLAGIIGAVMQQGTSSGMISYVGGSNDVQSSSNTNDIDLVMPTIVADDFALVFIKAEKETNTVTWGGLAGFTLIRTDTYTTARDVVCHLYYKKLTGGESDLALTANFGEMRAGILMVFRGVHTSSPLDATTTYATEADVSNSTFPAITTATDNAALAFFESATLDDINVAGVPTTPSHVVIAESRVGGPTGVDDHRQIVGMYVARVATAGTVTPTATTHTVTAAGAMEHMMYTTALRPA